MYGWSVPRTRHILVVASVVVVTLAAVQVVRATSSKPPYVEVAHGDIAGQPWSLAIAGRGAKRCYKQKLSGTGIEGATALCLADRRPRKDWTRLGGIGIERATIQLNVTKKRVHTMRLWVRHPHTRIRPRWVRVTTHRLTFAAAHEAHVKRNFRFAELQGRDHFCVSRVVLYDGSGDQIKRLLVRCEG